MGHVQDVINLNKESKMKFLIDKDEENLVVVELKDKKR